MHKSFVILTPTYLYNPALFYFHSYYFSQTHLIPYLGNTDIIAF